MLGAPTRQRRLRWIIAGSLGLMLRDLWLTSRGGGLTPPRLLRAETVAFALCATGGITQLNRESAAARRATTVFGYAGLVIHLVRLFTYLSRRRGHEPATA